MVLLFLAVLSILCLGHPNQRAGLTNSMPEVMLCSTHVWVLSCHVKCPTIMKLPCCEDAKTQRVHSYIYIYIVINSEDLRVIPAQVSFNVSDWDFKPLQHLAIQPQPTFESVSWSLRYHEAEEKLFCCAMSAMSMKFICIKNGCLINYILR